jgi:hypothetical protein
VNAGTEECIIFSVSKYTRWLISLTVVVALAFAAYAIRAQLERAVIAASIYHAHIFTAPSPISGGSRWDRLRDSAQFYWDFSEIPFARQRRLKLLDPLCGPIVKEINRRQAAGDDMHYSMHIYREIRWRLNFTPDIATTRARISDLRQSLTQPAGQKLAGEQQAFDGSWGLGIDVWYLKLYYSVDDAKECRPLPRYPLSFLDRMNSPEKLDAQLDSDLRNDFTKTGVFNREELDETFSLWPGYYSRLDKQGCYAFHPQLKNALRAFIERWQNPETGCWGQWLVDRQGRVWKMDAMAMTFHVISDLKGQVQHQDMIARRLLQLDHVNFPAGIRFDGHYKNHLNWTR